MHQSTTPPQSLDPHRTYGTIRISLNRRDCILSHAEHELHKLFLRES